jgi:ketosteroid isomerase-like protein
VAVCERRLASTRIGFVALSTFILGVAACTVDPNQVVARNEAVAQGLIDAQQLADTAALLELFWPDAVYDDFANQLQHRGITEIVSYATSVHGWADDVYLNAGGIHASETGAVIEWLFAAVQARPMGDFAPVATGREVVLNGVTILEIDGGRIRRAADYTDTTPLALQLGGRLELPGGRVVEWEGTP